MILRFLSLPGKRKKFSYYYQVVAGPSKQPHGGHEFCKFGCDFFGEELQSSKSYILTSCLSIR
jgi:hypothetical protein